MAPSPANLRLSGGFHTAATFRTVPDTWYRILGIPVTLCGAWMLNGSSRYAAENESFVLDVLANPFDSITRRVF